MSDVRKLPLTARVIDDLLDTKLKSNPKAALSILGKWVVAYLSDQLVSTDQVRTDGDRVLSRAMLCRCAKVVQALLDERTAV